MAVSPEELAGTLLRRASARRVTDETDRAACLSEVARAIPALRAELGFGRAWLIGSLAWGGFGVRSDIDVVVEGADVDAASTIAERLGEKTGRLIDVLLLETLPAGFRERVLGEGRHVP